MSVTVPDPPHAILNAEEVARLIAFVNTTTKHSFEYVAEVTGLPAVLLRKLVRDNIIEGSAPYRETRVVGWCDLEAARSVADQLAAARRPVEGVGILARAAAKKYGFIHPSVYRWRDDGWVNVVGQDASGDQLLNEGDIAVARALANLSGHVAGKPIFPQTKRK